ncbi:MAG: Rz1-like lysis system protein LysC [Symbiopectobacterium sp.]|uniref:Rz1-like lysis system protein LysC n=1 Tax=Symbiopectobacterium sp. TaxID=2952789 RepID=UPI003F407449
MKNSRYSSGLKIPWFTSVKSYRLMNVLFGLFLMMSLASCESTRTEYVMAPVVPIPAELLQDCPAPEIPYQMNYGKIVELNEELLTVIEKCNADKRSIREIEESRNH